MVGQLVGEGRWHVETIGTNLLISEVVRAVESQRPAALCVGSVAPGGLTHARHLCKRVRARCPDLRIVVGRWGAGEEQDDEAPQLAGAGADRVATSVAETSRQLTELGLLAPGALSPECAPSDSPGAAAAAVPA
jgi:hypothetical protein